MPGSVAVCLASVSGHMGAFDPAMDAVLDDPLAADLEARFQSLAGDEPDPGATYRLAKRGVIRLCERAAVAWGARGGRVVSLSPGLIDTEMGRLELVHNPIKTWMAEMTPVGGDRSGPDTVLPGRTDDIANTVAFLCSDRASFVSGCDVRVDGGLIAAMNHRPVSTDPPDREPTGGSSAGRRVRAREPGARRGAHRDRPAPLPRGHGVGRAAAGHAVPRARRRRLGLR